MPNMENEYLVLLILFYGVFVLGDVLTTFWLIKFYPEGIPGEMNPLAHLIFTRYSYLGMLLSKSVIFIIFSTVFTFLYKRYSTISWFRETLEIIILGLSGLSILVIINNVFAIILVSYYIYKTPPIFLLKILIFLLSIVIAELGALILFKDLAKEAEVLLGCLLALAPLFLWPTLHPTLYIAYTILLSIIIGSSAYLLESMKKER